MQRARILAALLVVSCLIAGCDSGGSPPVAPEEAKAAQDFVIKNNAAKGPYAKGKAPTSAPNGK